MKETLWSFILILVSISVLTAGEIDDSGIVIDSIIQVQETCDLSNGSLEIFVSGSNAGLEYSIDNGATWQTSNFFPGLPDDDYFIIVRDIFGCFTNDTAQISDAANPEIDIQVTCVPGRNLSDVVATVTGGTPQYQYEWEGVGINSTQEILTSVPPGFYSVTVTDRLGCSVLDTVTVEPCCELTVTCDIPVVEVDCITDIPEIDSTLIMPSTSGEDLIAGLDDLGIGLSVGLSLDVCPVLNLTIAESETVPSDCSDGPLIINRIYSISDAFFSSDCMQEIRVIKSLAPSISTKAQSLVTECGGSLESQFQDWLDGNASMMISGCSEPYLYSMEPELPVPPSGCNETVEVTFIVSDACENELRSTATFTMEDNGAPTLLCPPTLDLEPGDPLLEAKIDDWLETVVVNDNCNETEANNDFFPGNLSVDCAQSLTMEITFEAIDACDNQSSCIANIVIEGLDPPVLSCGDDLNIACTEDRSASFDDWIRDFSAIDGAGSNLDVTNDLDQIEFIDLSCNEEISVLFSITDDCGRNLTCLRQLSIVDTENPEIDCPPALNVVPSDVDVEDQITAWLEDFRSSDNCDDNPIVTHNFVPIADLCSVTDDIDVSFEVVDVCDNRSTCTTQLSVNVTVATLSCPNSLTLECGEVTEEIINDWLAQAVSDNPDADPINDFAGLSTVTGCSTPVEVTFSTSSPCGGDVSCIATLQVVDSTPPAITCPAGLNIDLLSGSSTNLMGAWLESVAATDCNSITMENDFDADISSVVCSAEHLVTFTAEDACGLMSSCNSRIVLSNDGTISMTCPDPLLVTCSQGDLERSIKAHLLNGAIVTADNEYEIELGDIPQFNTECETTSSIEIEVFALDVCGREASCSSLFELQPEPQIYIPNIISPDGDGLNDYFGAFGNESIDYVQTMIVYDRWGNKAYEANDLPINDERSGWDGRYNQVSQSAQVFTYLMIILDKSGNEIIRSGSVQVLK